jgi:hypothetical protein
MAEMAIGNESLDNQAVTPDELKGPEDDGSLAAILEKTPTIVFTGHPADESTEGRKPRHP